jgi:hypothetical protein
MHKFLVVVEIEAIEVDALAALDLLDAQDLTSAHFDRLAGARLDHVLETDFVRSHASGPLLWLIAGCGVFFQRKSHEAGAIRGHAAGDGAIDELELLPVEAQRHGLRGGLPVRWLGHIDLPVETTLSCTQEWRGGNASLPLGSVNFAAERPNFWQFLLKS